MRTSTTTGRPLVIAALGIGAASALVGCGEAAKSTELHPEGPPLVLQVFARERILEEADDGSKPLVPQSRLAFGSHPDIDSESDDGVVAAAMTSLAWEPPTDETLPVRVRARPARVGQRVHIVIDELLRGNNLEEVLCADGTTWSRVPLGTTPADIANCAGADLSKCTGAHAVCSGMGVMDNDNDKMFDSTRLIGGAVTLDCGGAVELNLEQSFYNPSGNQLIPAGSIGVDGLGPSVALTPGVTLTPKAHCTIAFGSDVVDKDGNRPCAPTDGAIDGTCAPGDMTLVQFDVEPFLVAGSEPTDASSDVPLLREGDADTDINIVFNLPLDPATVAAGGFVVTANGTPVDGLTAAVPATDPSSVTLTIPTGFQPATTYEVKVTGGAAGIKDTSGNALEQDVTVSWKTAEGA